MKRLRSLVSMVVVFGLLMSSVPAQTVGRARLSSAELEAAEKLESSTAFRDLIDELDRLASQEVELRAQLSREERRNRSRGLRAARESIRRSNQLRPVQMSLLGLTDGKVNRLERLTAKLKRSHPALLEIGDARRLIVLEEAVIATMKKGSAVRARGSVSRREQPPECDDLRDAYDACLAECKATWFLQSGIAFASIVSALLACAGVGPAWPICAGLATTTYLLAINAAKKAAEDCVKECEDWYGYQAAQLGCDEDAAGVDLDEWYDETESPSEYCRNDGDCPSDQFCWKGVATIGRNECRDEKSEGKTCSRHGQCESNCCKLHLWTNPVSKVCRPASKC